MPKTRLDKLLTERGLAESREKAQRLIMAGLVLVDNNVIDKPGSQIDETCNITLKETLKYVSRGGLKLETALKYFNLNFKGKIVIDIGASTGGFTDLCLQNGAIKVYSVDVGKNQLHEKLLKDERVINLEKTNFRYITFDAINEKADIIVSDVSFISLTNIIPSIIQFCHEKTEACLLIKPQFEAGAKFVGKNGVVRDKEVHVQVINKIIDFAKEYGLYTKGLVKSSIKGPKGNIEYLLYLKYNSKSEKEIAENEIRKVVYEEYCHCG
ncbi:MAG: TlyA family RNA methyltransferase [Deferribacterales bacterium]|uniref:TlyA family RNA methyltransferase n=1 Tax=Deferrivibrio essentukiensis TaxID=2880922 RepID=UPI0019B548FE|nr:TlyA family RNA methyltransferase [Deferrivibrio essentukiensis]MBC7195809.1 TlyA family RNA methyltransferase [Deferribacterales bacterium]MCB4204446.1 TlyA family RNA methyltransferase [Deferrivibrio essentukiensis]